MTADQISPGCCPGNAERVPHAAWGYVVRWWDQANGLPVGILLLYFLNAFFLTFPMYATMEWTQSIVKMSLSTISNYYAVIMIPWSLKPFYAMLIERCPIFGLHRKPWLVISSIIAASSFLLNAYAVRSAPLAFLSAFIGNIGLGCISVICGGALMDAAHSNMANAGAVQSRATSARALGSLAASLIHLWVYPCHNPDPPAPMTPSDDNQTLILGGGSGDDGSRLTWQQVYLVCAIGCALMSVCVFSTPEPPSSDLERLNTAECPGSSERAARRRERRRRRKQRERERAAGGMEIDPEQGGLLADEDSDCGARASVGLAVAGGSPTAVEPEGGQRYGVHLISVYVLGVVLPLEVILVWLTLRGLVKDHHVWLGVLLGACAVAPIIIGFVVAALRREVRRMAREREAAAAAAEEAESGPASPTSSASSASSGNPLQALRRVVWENRRILAVAAFLLLMNATPSAIDQLSYMNYDLYRKCDLTHMSLLGYGVKVVAATSYALLANSRAMEWVLPVLVGLAGLTSLLSIPLTKVAVPSMADKDMGIVDDVRFLGMDWDILVYGYFSTAVQAFFGRLALIPTEVVAVEQSPYDGRLLYYAMFLACFDSGASIREWISAPIVKALGITYTDYSNLDKLVWIAVATQIAVACLAPVVLRIGTSPENSNPAAAAEDNIQDGEEQQAEE